MTSVAWERYCAWNDALAARWFTEDAGNSPVYLDVDPDLLAGVAVELGESPSGVEALAEVVAESLGPTPGTTFDVHFEQLREWRRRLDEAVEDRELLDVPPPVVGLLAALTVAAYRMGTDEKHPAHAYWARFFDYLGIPAHRRNGLTGAFQHHSEALWAPLNEFLVHHGGRLGLPTAYALGHRYVGLPQSQALVRATDRVKLPGFFRAFGLPPGADLVPTDIDVLLDSWVKRNPPPVSANFVRLWKGKARERIAGVVALELAAWDGSYAREHVAEPEKSGDLALTALLRQRLAGQSLELSFAARFADPVSADVLRVLTADSRPTVAVVPVVGGRVRPAPGSFLDHLSLVGGKVEVADEDTDQVVHRLPRRVVPLHKDELLGVWVEAERLQLGEDALLLVKDEPALVDAVTAAVGAHGRFDQVLGARERAGVAQLAEVPDGWLLFTGVQVYGPLPPGGRADLQVLTPLASARLVLVDGLKLPGRVRKWLSVEPPELRAAVADPEADVMVALKPLDAASATETSSWTGQAGVLVVPLKPLLLPDGDFQVSLSVGGEVASESVLRLRSGSTPDLAAWTTATRLVYDLDAGAPAALSASDYVEAGELYVDGAVVSDEAVTASPQRLVPPAPSWTTRQRADNVVRRPVVLGEPDPNSCLVTGMHYMQFPTFYGGKARGHIEGVCKGCHLVKRSPATAARAKKQDKTAATPVVDLGHLPPYQHNLIHNDACLDALVHVGGGTIGAFERIATQADGSSIFVDELLRTLEVLGHVSVRRDERCQPVEWEVTPAQLAERPDGTFLLLGAWSSESRRDLATDVADHGGALAPVALDDSVTTWAVSGVPVHAVEMLAGQYGAAVARKAASRLVGVLPPLSQLEQGLHEVDVPSFTKAEKFDVASAAWVPIPGVVGPGAYRLQQSFRSVCLWLDEDGAAHRRGRIASTQLVKHLAARAAARPLLALLPGPRKLLVPLGADLPGLYGRAAVLCSGRTPSPSPKTRSLAYHDVTDEVASSLAGLLTS